MTQYTNVFQILNFEGKTGPNSKFVKFWYLIAKNFWELQKVQLFKKNLLQFDASHGFLETNFTEIEQSNIQQIWIF